MALAVATPHFPSPIPRSREAFPLIFDALSRLVHGVAFKINRTLIDCYLFHRERIVPPWLPSKRHYEKPDNLLSIYRKQCIEQHLNKYYFFASYTVVSGDVWRTQGPMYKYTVYKPKLYINLLSKVLFFSKPYLY